MASACVEKDVVVRATFKNMYKWPESDAEFLMSISSTNSRHLGHPKVVDSISCRQMYLKSYTFSRDDDTHEGINIVAKLGPTGGASKSTMKLKAAMQSVFKRLLSCTTKIKIDVVG